MDSDELANNGEEASDLNKTLHRQLIAYDTATIEKKKQLQMSRDRMMKRPKLSSNSGDDEDLGTDSSEDSSGEDSSSEDKRKKIKITCTRKKQKKIKKKTKNQKNFFEFQFEITVFVGIDQKKCFVFFSNHHTIQQDNLAIQPILTEIKHQQFLTIFSPCCLFVTSSPVPSPPLPKLNYIINGCSKNHSTHQKDSIDGVCHRLPSVCTCPSVQSIPGQFLMHLSPKN